MNSSDKRPVSGRRSILHRLAAISDSKAQLFSVIGVAVGISVLDYFDGIGSLVFCVLCVIGAWTINVDTMTKAVKNRILAFLFQVAICAMFAGLAYLSFSAGHRLLSSKSRDFADCAGGFLLVCLACFLVFGVLTIAAMEPDEGGSVGGGSFDS